MPNYNYSSVPDAGGLMASGGQGRQPYPWNVQGGVPTPGGGLPGQPGYDWGQAPDYIPPSEQIWGMMQDYIGQLGPSADYTAGMQGALGAAGGMGGYDAMQQYMPAFGQLLRGGGKAADAYATAAQKAAATGGLEGLKAVQAMGGQAGALGSTPHGTQQLDVANRYSQTMSDIEATRAGMKEQNLMGRMGMGLQGLGMIGGLAQGQYAGQAGAYGNIMGSAMQQQGLYGQQAMQGMQGQMGLEQFPYEQGYRLWEDWSNQQAQKPQTGVGDYLAAAAPLAGMFMPGAGAAAGAYGYLGSGNYGMK